MSRPASSSRSSWYAGPPIRFLSSAPSAHSAAQQYQRALSVSNSTSHPDPSSSSSSSHSHSSRSGIRVLLPDREYTIGDAIVSGFSTAGKFTTIQVKHTQNRHVRVLFDLGKIVNDSWISTDLVLISHGHLDHCGAILSHCHLRHLFGQKGAKYLLPQPAAEPLKDVLAAAERLQGGTLAATIIPVPIPENQQHDNDASRPPSSSAFSPDTVSSTARSSFRYPINRYYFIEPFQTVHRVPSTGYAIMENRTYLLPEFKDKSREEIVAAKRAGQAVNEIKEERVFAAFTGDTTVDFLNGPLFLGQQINNSSSIESESESARTPFPVHLLIMEMTFLDEYFDPTQEDPCSHSHSDGESDCKADSAMADDTEEPFHSVSAKRQSSSTKRIAHLTDSGHVILGEFLQWLRRHPNGLDHVQNILFIHVSQRHSPQFIIDTLSSKLPPNILQKSAVIVEKKGKHHERERERH